MLCILVVLKSIFSTHYASINLACYASFYYAIDTGISVFGDDVSKHFKATHVCINNIVMCTFCSEDYKAT